MENLFKELGIPKKYLKATLTENHFIVLAHKLWLKSLIKYLKLTEFLEKSDFESWPNTKDEIGNLWCKIHVRVFTKREVKAIPLPRIRQLTKDEPPLLLCQLLEYIYQTNYKNLWKETYKKYNYTKPETNKESQVTLVNYNDILKEIITRIYGCPIINTYDPTQSVEASKSFDVHLNILPAMCAIETRSAIFILFSPHFLEHTLKDCVTFSPAILEKCFTKPLFIIYQLLQALKSMHDRSLTLGDITLNDIYLSEDMWIYIIPAISSNIYIADVCKTESKKVTPDCKELSHDLDTSQKCANCGVRTYDKVQLSDSNLQHLCRLWLDGQISNFSYITALNKASGRKLGDPNCHYVFPWVTDFTSRCGKNWRDLKKSKYRLNKGDRQLDLTYENGQSQVPHHVSDVLSAITYYVYMARRTPKSVLCKNVRTIWVPAEYPSSIQRMQEWTPDECIPEFFTDPAVFRSIHDDLDDLEVPSWCTGPEDFIERHREALESAHVSERLHHWIDLTFGYKLAGNAAIKAKNVCLHLVDDHVKLTKSGIVQLFTHPHPPKMAPSVFWTKTPPKIFVSNNKALKEGKLLRDRSCSPRNRSEFKTDEEDTEDGTTNVSTLSHLGLSRFLSKSRSSLNEEQTHKTLKSNQRSSSLGPKSSLAHKSKSNFTVPSASMEGVIYLPKEYKPDQMLDMLEKRHLFFSKTFHIKDTSFSDKKQSKNDSTVQSSDNHGQYTVCNFRNRPNQKSDSQIVCNYSDIISSRRTREMQVLGCLLIEIFMSKQIRAVGANDNTTFTERLKACLTVAKCCKSDIPPCIAHLVSLLLQPDSDQTKNFKYPSVTNLGLPPPSAHLLLEPLMHRVVPWPKLFPNLYTLISNLKDFKNVAAELEVLYHFDCDGKMCAEYENLERTKILFAQNIGECRVKSCVKNMENLLEKINTTTDIEIVEILLPHILELIQDPPTCVLAAWYLFDSISKILGPKRTRETLLDSLLKLYESEPSESASPYNGKIAKLYHHSFLLRLIVRLGLKCFLENFVTPLVEAVGRYKDCEKIDFILHSHSEKTVKKTSHLKMMDASDNTDVSASDDSSDVSSEKRLEPENTEEPEVFDFEEEKDSKEQLKSMIKHLELNVASDLPFNHSTAEEALDATITENLEQLRSLEELNLVFNEEEEQDEEEKVMVESPSTSHNEFENISCGIGSRKSDSGDGLDTKSLTTPGESAPESPGGSFDPKKNVSKRHDTKVSDMSSDSLIWLSHRLGPVLTARYLSRNLLKMMTLCYVGKENLVAISKDDYKEQTNLISMFTSYVVGDQNASKVLECLTSVAGLYGEPFILFQYIPHMSELIALCKRKLTLNLEGGLISCLALLQHVIPYLSDATLMDQLQDVILKNILYPTVRLLASTKHVFPSGACARNVLARKYLDTLYVLSVRMGSDMSRALIAVPALQRFFLIFDKVYTVEPESVQNEEIISDDSKSHYVEVCRDGTTHEWMVGGKPVQIISKNLSVENSLSLQEEACDQAYEELCSVFNAELAYVAHLPFYKHIGESSLASSLKNYKLIRDLCREYERNSKSGHLIPQLQLSDFTTVSSTIPESSSIGSNIALIGNRIDVQDVHSENSDILSLVSNRLENNSRHLRGNWLAYWEHEIGRSDKDTMFNFKQIKLQTFAGHTHSVKCLYVLDNENSFVSASRDKTVKLWSLRSQGDGTAVASCQWTYTAHRKSVLSIAFIESTRLMASCDSTVHIWDPFMGVNVGHLESSRYPPVNVIKTFPAPSSLFFAATTDGSVKIVDTRLCCYIQEMKTSLGPTGLIRCLAVSPSGLWVAMGQSSGYVTVLDSRTGLVTASWKAHEGEVLQLVAVDESTIISSSLDQTVAVWNVTDGKFKFHLRGTTEPVHCLNIYGSELISGTTANRIGVHTSIDLEASFSSTKLRSDAFKGLLTSMVLLPLNRLLLLGADTGAINLLC